MDAFKEAESVDLVSHNRLVLLITIEAADRIEQNVLQVLANAKCLEELNDGLVFVVAEETEVGLTQLDVQLVIHVR